MKLRHDPLSKMSARDRARVESLQDNLLEMDPDELDLWLDENMKSVRDMKAVVRKLVLAVAALR